MISSGGYNGSLTRETFLFYEMRSTAQLLLQGMSDKEAEAYIVKNNVFQYPTEKTIARSARACLKRLHALNDTNLVEALVTQPSEIGKQICLYAMMRQNRLVWEFMITVIGEKYRSMNFSFGRIDLNAYFIRLQEQDDTVASWSDSTISRIKSTLTNMLVENVQHRRECDT